MRKYLPILARRLSLARRIGSRVMRRGAPDHANAAPVQPRDEHVPPSR